MVIFEELRPGRPVTVVLQGTGETITGTVETVCAHTGALWIVEHESHSRRLFGQAELASLDNVRSHPGGSLTVG